jgi:protein-tyrosine phosphatase
MRAAASVVAGSRGATLVDEALQLGAITHADPRSLVACAVYCAALRALVDGEPYPAAWRGAVAAVSRCDLAGSVGFFAAGYADEVQERLAAALGLVAAAVERGVAGEAAGNSGYVVTTLQSAVAAGAAASFAEGILPVVARGDDADTVAAITGAILAARGRMPPPAWLLDLRGSRRFAAWPTAAHGPAALSAMERAALRASSSWANVAYGEPIPPFVVRRFHPQILYGRNPLATAEIESLARAGVSAIIDLREEWEWSAAGRLGREAVAACARLGIERLHLPTADGGAPTAAALDAGVDLLERVLGEGRIAFVHCRAGIERTGALLLGWSVSHESDRVELAALAPAVEPLPGQVRAVYDWLQTRVDRPTAT